MHEKIMWHVHRERHRVNEVESVSVESAESHHEIVDAIVKRRAENAGMAMRKHLENVSRLILANRLAEQNIAPSQTGHAKSKTRMKTKMKTKTTVGRRGRS
jgi:chromatin remodeling complex protein RSC6